MRARSQGYVTGPKTYLLGILFLEQEQQVTHLRYLKRGGRPYLSLERKSSSARTTETGAIDALAAVFFESVFVSKGPHRQVPRNQYRCCCSSNRFNTVGCRFGRNGADGIKIQFNPTMGRRESKRDFRNRVRHGCKTKRKDPDNILANHIIITHMGNNGSITPDDSSFNEKVNKSRMAGYDKNIVIIHNEGILAGRELTVKDYYPRSLYCLVAGQLWQGGPASPVSHLVSQGKSYIAN